MYVNLVNYVKTTTNLLLSILLVVNFFVILTGNPKILKKLEQKNPKIN